MYMMNILLIIVLMMCGCSKEKQPTLEERVECARRQLLNGVERSKEFYKEYPYEHIKDRIRAYEKGLEILENQLFLKSPVPIRAEFTCSTDKGNPPACVITWLEDGFSIKGIVVVDKTGKEYRFKVFRWVNELKEWYACTVKRDSVVLTNIKGHWKLVDPNVVSQRIWPPINLPMEVFQGTLKVGLITKDNTYTDLIDAYIPPSFFEEPNI